MNKRKHENRTAKPIEKMPVATVVVTDQPRARSRTFTAKQCTSCTALRAANGIDTEDNFTRVIATRGNVLYCRCHYCGNTWKDSDAIPFNGS